MTDVAKRAGVSKMTVSRVLSGNGYVKEETRAAVQQAVHELNYRPNLLAKSLVTGRTQVIAYVLPDIGDPFFSNVCKATTDVCRELGYNSIVSSVPNDEAVDDLLNMVIDRKLDGVIFHHLRITQGQLRLLRDNGIKSVLIDGNPPLEGVVNIANDNYGGAFMAVEYLIECGYRRIACLRGDLRPGDPKPDDLTYTETYQKIIWADRTQGCLDALAKHGLEPFAMYYGRGSATTDKTYSSGVQIMRRILAQPEWPDAIYCESDLLALGALGELLESKVDVPGTIALCGHDGVDTCLILYPRVTTVVQPQYELGRVAARALIDEIEGKQQQNAVVRSSLFVGDTTR